jgi:hypothetical protein
VTKKKTPLLPFDAVLREWRAVPDAEVRGMGRLGALYSRAPAGAPALVRSVLKDDAPARLAEELRGNEKLRWHLPRLLREIPGRVLDHYPAWRALADSLEFYDEARRFADIYQTIPKGRGRPTNAFQKSRLEWTRFIVDSVWFGLKTGWSGPPRWFGIPAAFVPEWKRQAKIIKKRKREMKRLKGGCSAAEYQKTRKDLATMIRRRAVRVYLVGMGEPHAPADVTRLLERLQKAQDAEQRVLGRKAPTK